MALNEAACERDDLLRRRGNSELYTAAVVALSVVSLVSLECLLLVVRLLVPSLRSRLVGKSLSRPTYSTKLFALDP